MNCSNLIFAPELPLKTLSKECYRSMFVECQNLIFAPELPAVELVDLCYYNMFQGCENLSSLVVHFREWKTDKSATTNWLDGSKNSSECIFHCPTELTMPASRSKSNVLPNWQVVKDVK